MKKTFWTLACGLVVLSMSAAPALALPDFKKIFEEEIVEKNEKLAEPFKEAGCNTCHVQGEKKDVNNDFGKRLDALIEGDAAAKIKDASAADKPAVKEAINEEFKKALEKVLGQKPDGKEQTFGEMLEAGELPLD